MKGGVNRGARSDLCRRKDGEYEQNHDLSPGAWARLVYFLPFT